MPGFSLSFGLLFLLGMGAPDAQEKPVYQVFSVVEPEALANTLNRHAAEGYRLTSLASASNYGVVGVMERMSDGAPVVRYRVVNGAWAREPGSPKGEVQVIDEMNAGGLEGFRFVPAVVLGRHEFAAAVMQSDETDGAQFTYRLFAPAFPSQARWDNFMAESEKDGFHVVFHGLAGFRPVTLMEKQIGPMGHDPGPPGQDRLIGMSPIDMEGRARKNGTDGFVLYHTSHGRAFDTAADIAWFHKMTRQVLRLVIVRTKPDGNPEAEQQAIDRFVAEINGASAEGWHLVAAPVECTHITYISGVKSFLYAAMQQKPELPNQTYRRIHADSLPEVKEALNAAARNGFRAIPWSMGSESAIYLEGAAAPAR